MGYFARALIRSDMKSPLWPMEPAHTPFNLPCYSARAYADTLLKDSLSPERLSAFGGIQIHH